MPISGGSSLVAADIWTFINNAELIGQDIAVQSGAINAFGAWTQLVAATTLDIYTVTVGLGEISDAAEVMQYEIGVGAALAEVAIAGGAITHDETEDLGGGHCVPHVVHIPAGSRVSIRTLVRGVVANINARATAYGGTV